ncbi:hypothetical protein CELL_00090 [Cellulomonas sp. T2.31MG-18]|uniref:hypothetical protein n=1 Tax=Cellulomonas sp. T2.31MG-18 TaxID=3157619 RepID=UPI0035EF6DC3
MRVQKVDLVAAIASALGVQAPKMSTGSTEPKEIFLIANEVLGLGLPTSLTKPELAKGIVEAAGHVWTPSSESRGGTVTTDGLERVLAAVRLFVAQ